KNQNGETADYSFVQRGYVRHWLGQVWEEYDRIKLKDNRCQRRHHGEPSAPASRQVGGRVPQVGVASAILKIILDHRPSPSRSWVGMADSHAAGSRNAARGREGRGWK